MNETINAVLDAGTPVLHSDAANYRHGVVLRAQRDTRGMYVIGGNGLQPIDVSYDVVWLDDFGKGIAISEKLGASIVQRYAANARGMAEHTTMPVLDQLARQARVTQACHYKARLWAMDRERDARAQYDYRMRSRVPGWAKAVIIGTYEIDDCDSMTDYYATKRGKEVVLGFSRHTRNLFPELRKAAANFEGTRHLATKATVNNNGEARTESNKKWWTPADEHRENYSMGAGTYLKATHRYSSGWAVRKVRLNAANPMASIPRGEWFTEPQTTAPAANSAAITLGGATIEQHEHTKRGFLMHIVIPAERMPRDQFMTLLADAKRHGGWYSRKWGNTPGGYAFKDASAAKSFAQTHFEG